MARGKRNVCTEMGLNRNNNVWLEVGFRFFLETGQGSPQFKLCLQLLISQVETLSAESTGESQLYTSHFDRLI